MREDPRARGGSVSMVARAPDRGVPAPRTSVIRGLHGLRDIVCLSAVLTTVGSTPGVERVRRVSAERGEIEVEGTSRPEDLVQAIDRAAALLAETLPEVYARTPGERLRARGASITVSQA